MIQIEDTQTIPDFIWAETSKKEFGLMPRSAQQLMLSKSSPIKIAKYDGEPLAVAGLYYQSFVSVPYLWVLLTDRFASSRISVLRNLIKLVILYAAKCETLIEAGNVKAERLAKVFGFTPTETTMILGSDKYIMYRRG
jgi:hypothetical protein